MAEIDEFLQQVLADQREWDVDPTPKSPAYELLAAERLEEAEAGARQAVSDLEKENAALKKNVPVQPENVAPTSERATLHEENSPAQNNTQLKLLADALIAHGIALARVKRLEAAQATLERAIALSEEAGVPDKAGLAGLTMIEELEHLSRETLLSLYEQASAGMAKMRNRKLQWRLIRAAKKIITRFRGEMDPDRALDILLAPPSLHDELVRHEKALIKQVMAQRNASISEDASLLHSDSGAAGVRHRTET